MSGNKGITPEESAGTRITKENANEMRLKGLAVRRHLAEQRAVWERPADLPKEIADFYAMFGFVGERQRLIDNKYKFAYKALKKAFEKGDLNNIIKFFNAIGLDWAADAAQFMAALNATIGNKNEENAEENKPVQIIVTGTDDEPD